MKSKLVWILLGIVFVGWLVYAMNPVPFFYYLDNARKIVCLDANAIKSALQKAQRANAEIGKEPPKTLEDAVEHMEGSGPFTLLDPWGRSYQLKWIEVKGEQQPVVWTIAPDGQLISTEKE